MEKVVLFHRKQKRKPENTENILKRMLKDRKLKEIHVYTIGNKQIFIKHTKVLSAQEISIFFDPTYIFTMFMCGLVVWWIICGRRFLIYSGCSHTLTTVSCGYDKCHPNRCSNLEGSNSGCRWLGIHQAGCWTVWPL